MSDLKPRGVSEIFEALRSQNRARIAERDRRTAAYANEAFHDLHALATELQQLAFALSDWQLTDQRKTGSGDSV
jgi:hypothetical protein